MRARNNLALLLVDPGQLKAVEPMHAELTRQWRDRAPDDEGSYLVVAINYAHLLERLDRVAEAATILDASLARARADYPAEFWLLEIADARLAHLRGESREAAQSGIQTERARALEAPRRP